ncbi:MAG: response regulator [Pseudomonadota bacterium]
MTALALTSSAHRPAPGEASEAEHIAVVDDDSEIRTLVARHLKRYGYRVTTAEDAAAYRRASASTRFDLVVLDVMMPGEDGLSLCRDLRASSDLPVILLTAMAEETDRIVGLEMGADDYLPKPFNARELVARIRAVLRRAHALPPLAETPSGRVRFDGRVFDLARRELQEGDGVTDLSEAEARLLRVLIDHAGIVLSRDLLLDLTRGRSAAPFDRAVDTQVSRLRRKVERDPSDPRLIVTHRVGRDGGGYAFEGDVEWL